MAIYCGDNDSFFLLENAAEFREICLIQGKSLFTELAVWNSAACSELIEFFVENLEEGEGDFLAKLETQLGKATPAAKVLAAEMLWLMFLCPSSTGQASKRTTIERVFSWSGFEFKDGVRDKYLSDEALTGIGKTGAAYQTGRWRELVYFIRLLEKLFKLSKDERATLLASRTEFSSWLNDIPGNDKRQFRHMILYLFYPEEQERIFGGGHRQSLLETFLNITPSQYKKMSPLDVDNRLLEIRTQFEKEYGTKELDYYVVPLSLRWGQESSEEPNEIKEPGQGYEVKINDVNQTLNTILYGPPGTGKTYNTINKALEIVDPEFYHQNNDDRAAIKKRFDELLNSNRIGFVTFHQSFSYEDFVEGLKATTENNQVNYEIEDGIFKNMCQKADKSKFSNFIIYRESFASFYVEDITDELIVFRKKNGNRLPIAREVIDEFCAAYENEKFDLSLDQKYWLKSFENRLEPYLITGFDSLYRDMLPKLLERRTLQPATASKAFKEDTDRLVLIIDEINRGNISNIFGELITLIEPSKRAGGKEALSVKLPYSKEAFSVPDNLHIIGTMNTADKSLAQLDIALRRRFQFEEMMTNYELLAEIPLFDGIDIEQMVRVINKRIELLYDREHTIGHSFFLSLKDTPSIEHLAEIFELQILPLLEEYFFEDWERVAMVLGDHLKADESLRFVVEQFDANEVAQLMGDDWDQTGIQPYVRNDQAFNAAAAYIGIYS
ncbi:McrB family protein [Vibrio splendidus]